MPFDTVSQVENWLDTEPSVEEVKDAIEEEESGQNRTTAIDAMESYLTDEPEPTANLTEFKVVREHEDYEVGDIVELDANDEHVVKLRRLGVLKVYWGG